MTTTNLPPIIRETNTHFISKNDMLTRLGTIISTWSVMTGTRAHWPMSLFNTSGAILDATGAGRTLTRNGDPVFSTYNQIVPQIVLDGTGDYWNRASEAALNIAGTETYIDGAFRGMTVVGWFYCANAAGTLETLVSKWATNQQSYLINRQATGVILFAVSNLGTDTVSISSTGTTPAEDTWFFAAGRFDPSVELKLFLGTTTNGYETFINTTAIPASIFAGTADFVLGGLSGGTSLLTGRESLVLLSAAYLTDAQIFGMFEQSRVLFGV